MDLEAMRRKWENNAAVAAAADSPEARRLAQRMDTRALEKAIRGGDGQAMGAALRELLSTDEGKALARRLKLAVGERD